MESASAPAFAARAQSAVMTEEMPPAALPVGDNRQPPGRQIRPRSSQILFVTASKKIPSLRKAWK